MHRLNPSPTSGRTKAESGVIYAVWQNYLLTTLNQSYTHIKELHCRGPPWLYVRKLDLRSHVLTCAPLHAKLINTHTPITLHSLSSPSIGHLFKVKQNAQIFYTTVTREWELLCLHFYNWLKRLVQLRWRLFWTIETDPHQYISPDYSKPVRYSVLRDHKPKPHINSASFILTITIHNTLSD